MLNISASIRVNKNDSFQSMLLAMLMLPVTPCRCKHLSILSKGKRRTWTWYYCFLILSSNWNCCHFQLNKMPTMSKWDSAHRCSLHDFCYGSIHPCCIFFILVESNAFILSMQLALQSVAVTAQSISSKAYHLIDSSQWLLQPNQFHLKHTTWLTVRRQVAKCYTTFSTFLPWQQHYMLSHYVQFWASGLHS